MRIGITKSVLAASLVVIAAACKNNDEAPEQPQATVAVRDSTRAFGGTVRDDRGRPILTSRPDATPRRDARVKRLHLDTGTEIEAVAVNTITSRTNHAGDRVTARVVTAVLDSDRDTVIPVGATLTGVVQAIASAENPREEGVLRIAFGSATWDGVTYPIHVDVKAMGAGMHNRGATAGDAAKVGAGTVAGAVAGRVIGGNRRGTIIGAAAGTVAGAVYANQTRDIDIVLPEGGRIRLELTQPFAPEIASAKP